MKTTIIYRNGKKEVLGEYIFIETSGSFVILRKSGVDETGPTYNITIELRFIPMDRIKEIISE